MKTMLLVALVGAVLGTETRAAAADLPIVTHYGLNAQFLLKENRVRVEADLTVHNTTPLRFRELPLLLYRLLAVQSVGDSSGRPVGFQQGIVQLSDEPSLQARAVVLTLPDTLLPGQSLKLKIAYEGYIFGYPEVMAYVRDRIDEVYSLFRTDALAYPVLAEASFKSVLAANDTTFTYEIRAVVPASYTAVCGGQLTARAPQGPDSTVFVFRSKVPTWRIDVAVAQFNTLGDTTHNLLIYHLPGDSAGARRVLEATRKAVGFYSGMFGTPAGYRGYTVIEIPDGWGSQAGDYYFLQSQAAFADSSRIGEVYHEIGHSWNVTPSPQVQRCRYFDEAFASYFESLALRAFEGERRFSEDMEKSRDLFVQWANRDREVSATPIAEYGAKELGRHSYTKGAWSLFVLSRVVGEEDFTRIVRAMLAEFGGRTIDFAAFQDLCERVSKRSLSRFFDEWIYGAESSQLLIDGIPIAEIAGRY